jgi:hypothetical protein
MSRRFHAQTNCRSRRVLNALSLYAKSKQEIEERAREILKSRGIEV